MPTPVTRMHALKLPQIENQKVLTFVQLVLIYQCAVLVFIALDEFGVHVVVLRQLACTIYLTFIPGLIIVKILKLTRNKATALLFAVGLSLLTLMSVGLLLNFILPRFFISNPISWTYVVASITAVTLFLLAICYFRGYDTPIKIGAFPDLKSNISPSSLFLLLLPFLSVLGSFFVNNYNDNILLLCLVLLIALVPILVVFERIPKKLYALAIFVMALSLLYHRSLISGQLWGADIFAEYYFASQVVAQGFWNFTIPNDYNAVLSVVLIPPIYSIYSNIDLVWVYKTVFPFLYAFVPLGIYAVLQKQLGEKTAFLSCCLFIFGVNFYGVNVPRQYVAELFFILLIIVIVSKEMVPSLRSVLFITFTCGLVVSHYAISYFFLFFVVIALVVMAARRSNILGRIADGTGVKTSIKDTEGIQREKRTILRLPLVVLILVLTFGWYLYVAGASSFVSVVSLSRFIGGNIGDFLNPDAIQGLDISTAGSSSFLYTLLKDLYFVSQFFIAVGLISAVLGSFFRRSYFKPSEKDAGKNKLDDEYLSLAIAAFALLLAALTIPYLSGAFGTTRLYQFTLILLSPFFVYGIMMCLKPIYGAKALKSQSTQAGALKLAALFLVVFLLFNAGFILEVLKDPDPSSIALSSNQVYRQAVTHTIGDESGGKFLGDRRANQSHVLADAYARQLLRANIYPGVNYEYFDKLTINTTVLPKGSYVYLSRSDLYGETDLAYGPHASNATVERPYASIKLESAPFWDSLMLKNKIYDNGDSQVFL